MTLEKSLSNQSKMKNSEPVKVLSERSKSALIRLMNDGSLEKITKNKFRIRIKDTTLCNEILHRIIRLEQFYKGDLIEKNEFFCVIRKLLEQQPLSFEEKRLLCRFVIGFSQQAQTLQNLDLKNTNYPLIVLPKKITNSLNVGRNDNLMDVQKSLMICEFFYNKCKCTYERVPDEFLNKIRSEFFPSVPDSIDTRDIEYFFGNTFVFIDKAFQKLKELAMLNMNMTSSRDWQVDSNPAQATQSEATLPNFRSLETSIRAEGIDFPELTDYGLHKNPDQCGQNQIVLKAENAPELPNEREGENLSLPYLKALPSQPKIIQANFTPNKIEFPDDCGEIYIAFTCEMDVLVQERIFSFEAFAFMESPTRPKSDWEKIGEMKFFELPMMMKLHRIKKGFKYFFALRAIDIRKRAGPYSFPLLLQT